MVAYYFSLKFLKNTFIINLYLWKLKCNQVVYEPKAFVVNSLKYSYEDDEERNINSKLWERERLFICLLIL